MLRNHSFLFMLGMAITTLGSVRFTKMPSKTLLVFKGDTARLEWEYHVDDRNREFDINSPKWNFYTAQGVVMNIASEDMFNNWKWILHRDTCPPRLLNPTRVFKESQATLVIRNVTSADSGVYGCRLVLLRTMLPITSKVTLSVSGNVTNISQNETGFRRAALPSFTENNMINKSLSDHIVKTWNKKSLVLRCIINHLPMPNITWYNPVGQDITNASRPTKEGSQLSLTILRESDYGTYTCRAESAYGFDEHKINVTNSCVCSSITSRQKAAVLHKHKNNSNLGLNYKKLYIVCLGIIGVSWVLNVFIILKSRSIAALQARSTPHNRQFEDRASDI